MQRKRCVDDGRHAEDKHTGGLDEDALKPFQPCVDLVVPFSTDRFVAAELRFKAHAAPQGVPVAVTGFFCNAICWASAASVASLSTPDA